MAERALSVSLAALSQTGRRERNEDAFGYWEGAGSLVAVLCDGAGGHGGGQTASRAAVTHVLEAFALHPEVSVNALQWLVHGANRAVVAQQVAGTLTADMRTTIVVLLLDLQSGAALWAHVGDSRLYRWRDAQLLGRTRDQTLEQRLRDAGLSAAGTVSGQLTSALGSPEGFDFETLEAPQVLASGDALLLCTDGLWSAFDELAMARSLAGCSGVQAWLDRLEAGVEQAGRSDQDNYSALAVWCAEG
ncbi:MULTISPECIES: protein phosphatase 2C domain-containing protein [unclassified Variovorax]|uniref:PP2C family protein-serine/threonine phosphatase n=1 Tax=unclassified Variovorax TaxID=663243 RepID=UPI00076D0A43|nr:MULTISPECIES: protein phosphatase 2C domain-containing protein [unclassified Variovorax]KWT65635.1 protein serine/threonine phosphatase [Variovorax sp. WDL1]PNG47350.1 Serine/threonine phosphatase stp [Variovorax sp. B2]PNG47999.1 Serine/threonine phosphatase stp [Variovorax sp. B4]VTV15248.1 PP2C-family Ser/Thr phosphatase [Variovorax sp. WDL1]